MLWAFWLALLVLNNFSEHLNIVTYNNKPVKVSETKFEKDVFKSLV